jgi:very-short-patch-repair endonuclease
MKNIKIARKLRKNMTKAERLLWGKLRNKQLGAKFRRQSPIGKYIVDFVCFERKLIIEVDGSQHLENKDDRDRDKWFENNGFKVLRFWNNDVMKNVDGVLEMIRRELPSPQSSPMKGEEEHPHPISSPFKGENKRGGEKKRK